MQALCDFATRYGPAAGRFLITLIFLRSAFGKINQTNHFYKNVSILGALVSIMGMGPGALALTRERGDTAPGRREGVGPAT